MEIIKQQQQNCFDLSNPLVYCNKKGRKRASYNMTQQNDKVKL